MKKLLLLCIAIGFACQLSAQEIADPVRQAGWQVGIGFGELPYQGSFKPSFTFGYNVNEHWYLGLVYQLKDEIRRNEHSFNAQSSGLTGIRSASEQVARRMMIQARYTPFRNGPYASVGFVYNGRDVETMQFDNRERTINGAVSEGSIGIVQTRRAGWGPALGIGYAYHLDNGLGLSFEWTPAWFTAINGPDFEFSGTAELTAETQNYLTTRMTEKFRSTVTNKYKIFHLGLSYQFD